MDVIVLIGSGVGLLAIWIALSCLIMVLRDRFTRDEQTEPHASWHVTLRRH